MDYSVRRRQGKIIMTATLTKGTTEIAFMGKQGIEM
jgi:hypothetical protein